MAMGFPHQACFKRSHDLCLGLGPSAWLHQNASLQDCSSGHYKWHYMTLLDQWIGLKEHHGTSYYSRVFLWVSRRFSHASAAGRLLPCHRRRWRRWPPWYRPRAGNDGYLSTVAKQFDYVLKYYNIYNINLYYIYISLSLPLCASTCMLYTYIILYCLV